MPYFKRSEHKYGNADPAFRGTTGELPITDLDWHHPLSDALIDAAVSLGIPRNADHNAYQQERAGYSQRTMKNGLRVSAAKAFLSKARKRQNVSIRTNCHTTNLLFEGRRAKGVEYLLGGRDGTKVQVHARREVILSAGALNTPKLLQLSGIGPADALASNGIDVRHQLPGVGNNLRDHYAVRMVSRVAGIKTINELVQGPQFLLQTARWLMRLPSPLAISPSVVHIFCKSDSALDRPDLEFACAPASFREGVIGLLDKHPGLTLGVWQERPESLGFAHIKSRDPHDPPKIQPHYLTDQGDQRVLLGGMRVARALFRAKPLQKYVVAETSPAPDLQTDDELLDFARRNGTTAYHMIGTARMGPATRKDSVVDNQLPVHGLDGLRVADASIMPSMPAVGGRDKFCSPVGETARAV